jgi:hypothetical protein
MCISVNYVSASPIANSFIWPVKGVSVTDIQANITNPTNDGWVVVNDYGNNPGYSDACYAGSHPGEDFNLDCYPDSSAWGGNCDMGEPVYAVANGTVISAYDLGNGLGWGVVIEHQMPEPVDITKYVDPSTQAPNVGLQHIIYSAYLHLKDVSVSAGTDVSVGQRVGGITDAAGTGAHLHFEVRFKDLAKFPCYNSLQALTDKGMLVPALFLQDHVAPHPSCTISSTGVTVISEDSACVERGGSYWWETEGEGGGAYYTYTTDDPGPDSYLKWHFDFEESGLYEFEASIPALENLTTKARYKFWLQNQVIWAEVSQSANKGGSVSLGQHMVDKGADQALRLNDNTGEAYTNANGVRLVFDAIKITPVRSVGTCASPPCDEEDATDSPSGTVNEDVPATDASGCTSVPMSRGHKPKIYLIVLFGLISVMWRNACGYS